MGECAGSGDEGAVVEGFAEALRAFCSLKQFGGSNSGFGFAPVGRVGRGNGETGETEVGHGTGSGADVERVARRDEDDFDADALVGSEQETIVVPK